MLDGVINANHNTNANQVQDKRHHVSQFTDSMLFMICYSMKYKLDFRFLLFHKRKSYFRKIC